MNNTELNRLLKNAKLPPRSKEYWEEFPDRVARELRRPLPERRQSASWVPRLAWAGAFAVVCILIGFGIGQRQGRDTALAENGLLQNRQVIEEVMAMFPNRVRAIVQDENGINIVLADKPDVAESPPLWVKVCRGTDCVSLVTFSGQELTVAGQQMTVLLDSAGEIILMGDQFVWSKDDGAGVPGDLHIRARPLELAGLN